MTEEEKKAIEYYKEYAETMNNEIILYGHIKTLKVDYKKLKILVNLIQKQDTEINKLNNVIDRMAGDLYLKDEFAEFGDTPEGIKEYFMKE